MAARPPRRPEGRRVIRGLLHGIPISLALWAAILTPIVWSLR